MEGAVEELPRCAAPRLLEDTFRIIRGGISRPGIHLLYALDALKFLLPPIDAFLKEGGKEAEARFAAHADALDKKVASGAQLEDAVLLAALLLPIAESAPADESTESRPQVAKPIEDLLSELVQSARLPRRIAERCRMILFAQKTLSGERRRRGSLQSFRRHPLFNEALTVFELSVAATGEHQEALEAWQSGTAPQPAAGAEGAPAGGKRRRRRRRRRGGGDEGGAEESAPPAAAESTEG
jgi:poly(A) polymerase